MLMKNNLRFLFIIFSFFALTAVNAQDLVDYICTSTTETYVPLGTSATVMPPSSQDDGYAALTLPFNLSFGNATFNSGSSIYVCTNGYITLNTSYSSTTPSTSGNYSVISPLGHDLHMRDNGKLKYQVTGTTPDRVLTIEWNNVESYSAGNVYNFQVKLYESNDTIKFCYGNNVVTASKSAYCFLREYTENESIIITNGWNSPVFNTTSASFSQSLDASNYPSAGKTYTFVRPYVACDKPATLTVSNVTANSADFAWTAGGSETAWEVACAPVTVDVNTLTPTVVTTMTYSAQNLINDVLYVFYVRAQCPNGSETSPWKKINFRTECGAGISTLPYYEDFSSYGGTGSYTYFPSCWNRSSTAGNYPYISSTGGNSLYLYTSSGNYTYATAPALAPAISPNTVAMRFKMYAGSQSYILKVGVMTDSSDISTFVPVATFTPSATSVWEEKDVYFNSYSGTGQFIAFLSDARTLSSSNIIYIDEVNITPLPTCARPASLTSINASDNSITLQWATAGTENQWNVKYYETGDTTTMVTTTANTNPFAVSGLTPNTSYTFFVQANCGTETSEWSVPYTTPTLYTAPAVLPFVCDFESSSEAANWGFENDTCANQWVIGDAANHTASGNSALYISNDNGVSNHYTFTAPATVFAVRDILMDNSYDYYTLTYDYKGMGQGTTDYLRLYLGMTGVSMVQGNATGTVPSIPGAVQLSINGSAYQSGQADWSHVNFYLDKETWGNRVLRLYFMWRNDASSGLNPAAAIDNIVVKGYNCPRVEDLAVDANTLTTTSATINWTDSLNTGNYEVVIVPMGGNPDNETPVTASSTTYTFTGLTHSTEYTAYVRVSCGTGVSAWRGVTFSTVCGQISTLPYTQNFDNQTTGSSAPLPNCWTRTNNYSTYPYLSTSYHASGNASLYFYGTSSYYSYAVLPEIDTTTLPINTLLLRLKSLKTSTTSTYGRFDVGVMSDPANVSTFTVVKSFHGTDMPQTTTWYNQEVMFNNFTGTGSYIAIRIPNEGTSYVYIDDVELDLIPSCLPPTDIVLSGITSEEVTVSWTPRNSEYNWNVVVVPSGTDASTGTPQMTSTYPYTVTNLQPNTQYDVYVQADCGSGDESPWSSVVTFTTKCIPTSTLPYTESFDGQGSGTFPSCWTRISTYNAQYPYINTTIHSDGNAALYFYQPSGTYTTLAATQALDLSTYNPGELALSFHISAYNSLSYARMDVGVMTDPTDMGTFTILKSFYASDFTATSHFNEVIIPLTQQYTTPVYFAFHIPASSTTSYMYVDQVKVDYAPSCYAPTNLQVNNVSSASAYLTWNGAPNVTDYVMEYSEQGQNNWMPVNVTGTSYFLTGLTSGVNYDVMLYSDCGSSYSDTLTANFGTLTFMDCLQPDTVPTTIGTSTTTTYQVPVNNLYNYTYSQQIFTATEIDPNHTPTVITGIGFNYGYSSSNTYKSNVKIYLAHRSNSSFANTSDWTPISNAQLVYEGPLVCTQGWNTFNFQQYFSYNGTDNLVVIVDDNSGDYNGSSYVFNAHTASDYRSLYYCNDFSNPDPTSPPVATSRSQTRADVRFYKCSQTVPMSCVAPNMVITNVTDQEITVDWAAGGSETQWELDYRIGTGSWTSVGTVTTPPYILTNVTNDVDYTFRMRSDCGNNEYSTYTTATVHVPCTYVTTLPLIENFDANTSSGVGHMVPCWTRNTNYSTQYPYTSSSYHHSGSYSVYFYATSAYYSYIASPRFDDSVPMDSLMITFQAYKTSANYFIEVGVMSDPDDISTFVPVGSFSPQQLNSFEFGNVITRGYTGNGHYVAFRCPQWITNYIYLDDVMIDYIPECAFVTNPHVIASTITTNSARVTWTPGGTETDWEVVCSANPVNDPSTLTAEMVQNTPSLDLTNLTPNTLYYVYVRANCGSSYSPWMMCQFRTACAALDVLPYSEDFESYTTGSSSNHILPNCWDYINSGTSSVGCPTINSGSTYAHGKCLYFYSYSTSTYADQIAILPEINTTALPMNTLRLAFNARRYNTTTSYVNYLEIGVIENSTFVPIDTITFTSTTISRHHVDFDNYTGTSNRMAIRAPKPTGSYTYNFTYLDDITIEEIPQCANPVNLEVSSVSQNDVTISWQPGDQEYEWTLSIYPAGSSISAGTTVTVNTDTFYTFTNLLPNTDYQVYLQAICPSGTGSSENVGITFSTLCDFITTLPFTENFDGVAGASSTSVAENNLPSCWFNHNTGTSTSYSGYPIVYNSAANAASGSNSMRFYVSTTTGTYSTQWAMLPAFDVTQNPMSSLMLSFDARSTSTSTPLVLEVGVMDNPFDVSSFTLVSTITASGTTYTRQEVYFSGYNGTGNVIAIRAPQGGTSNYGNVDNIVVDLTPDCSPVNDLAVSQIAATSALVTWTQGTMGVPVGFEVEYSEHNQNNWTTLTTQDNFYLLSGLNLNTSYDVRVRTDCGGVTSVWATEQFTTNDCLTQSEVTIGNGTTTSYQLPLNNLYRYTYSQQIFLASEMGGPATINSVSFDYNYSSAMTLKTNVDIYLGHTTKSTFTSSSDYIRDTSLVQVYSGNLNCHQGWNTFTFTTPFQYNGTDNLVLVVDDNSNNYNSNSYVFNVHSAGANRSLHYYSDTYNMSPSNPYANSPSSSYSSGNRNNVKFGMPCDASITCVAPNVYVTNVTSTTADVYWVPGYLESAWNFEYKAQNDSIWTSVTATTSPQQLTGLNPNTAYMVRMQSDCGGDTSSWASRNFTTECAAVTIPYTQNFDNDGTGSNAHPGCWTVMNNYSTTTHYPYISTSYHTSGTAGLYFYCSTPTYNLAVSPQIDLSNTQMNSLLVSFQMRSTSSITSGIVVGVMTNPNDMTTFEPVDTVYNSVTGTFEPMEVLLNNYSGTGEYVALKLINSTGTYSVYLDDFVIDFIPSCVRPNNLTATATQNDITLSWNDANTGYEWIIEYGTGNFVHGTGTVVVANSNPYTITGLTPSTMYTFYVRGICSATDSSAWSLPFHANTACAPIATLPYTENFDSYVGATSTSVSINNLPVCWNYLNHGTSTSYSGYPIIYNSSSSAQSGVNSMRFYTYTTSGTYDDQIAILPQLDVTANPMNTLQVTFDARVNTTSYPFNLVVGVMTNPANKSTFVPVDTITTQVATYNHYEVMLNQYTGSGAYIALMAPQPITGYNYGYVDNITVEPIPSCPKPTALTATAVSTTSINLSWVENGSATAWEIEYSTSPFTPGTGAGTTVQATTNPFTLTGLTTSTTYYFYVRAVCSPTDQSYWSTGVNEATLCNVIVVTNTNPYTENFDNVFTSLPECWDNTNDYGSTDWEVSSSFDGSVLSAHSGSKALQFYQSGSGDESSVQMPTFDISGVTNPSITYWYTNEDWAGDQDELIVYYRATPTAAWTQLATHYSSVSTWTKDSLTLPNPSATYQIKFKGLSNYGYGINIDDITISGGGGSPAIVDPTVTTQAADNISANAATLHGTVTAGSESITSQGFEWKTTSGGTYTAVNATGTTMSHNLTGLTPNTGYTFRAFATTASGTTYGTELTFTTTNDQTPCSSPTNVEVSNITDNTAVVSWTQPGTNATSWDVLYRQSGADSWFTLTTPNNPYTLVGLSASVSYEVQIIAHCSNNQTSDPSATITFTTTGIDDHTLDNSVTVYPNPTTGLVQIQNGEWRMENVEVYDAYGKLLNTMIVNDNTVNLDLSGYAKGTYFVRVTTERGVVTKRVVKN